MNGFSRFAWNDNEDVLECERAFLESLGYTALIAPSSNKVLELASIHSLDVVVAVQNYTVCLLWAKFGKWINIDQVFRGVEPRLLLTLQRRSL